MSERPQVAAGEDDLPDARVEAKLAAIRKAATYNLMLEVDIDTMLAQIDTRYDQDLPGLD